MSKSARELAVERLACPGCGGPFRDEQVRLRCRNCGHVLAFDRHGVLLASADMRRRLTPAQRVGQWPLVARAYDAWRRHALTLLTGASFSPDREWHVLFGELPFGGPRIYLDNATASGYLGRALARRLATTQTPFVIIANDLSLPMLHRAAELAKRDGIADRLFFIHAASETLPLRAGSVDGILCGGSLNEFTDVDRVLREWARLLAPGGSVSVMLQTLSAGWRGRLQRSLSRRLGLTIEESQRTFDRFDAALQRRRWTSYGPILFLSGGRRSSVSTRFPSQAA